MKLYIENIKYISNFNKLDNLYKNIISYKEIYSIYGIFNITNDNIYKLSFNDKNIKKIDINNIILLIDFSEIIYNKVNSLPNNTTKYDIKLIKYKLNKESKISFNIKYLNNIIKDFYFEINDLKECDNLSDIYINDIKKILDYLKI